MKYLHIALILISAAVLPLSAETKKIVVVYTNSLNGYIDYCTCKADPKGGLVKRGTVLKELRKQYADRDMYLADTGDFLPVYSAEMLPPFIFKAYEHLAYDALTFGDQDLDHGINQFITFTGKLPIVNTNAAFTSAKTKDPFPKRLIVQKNKSKAVFIAVQSADAYRFSREDTRNGLSISNPAASISAAVTAAESEKPDIKILLSHSGFDEDQLLAEKIKGVQLIIGGHSQTMIQKPVKKNGVYILQAGTNGSHIGIAEIEIIHGRISSLKNRFITPDFNSPEDDPYIRSLIKEYHQEQDNTSRKFD